MLELQKIFREIKNDFNFYKANNLNYPAHIHEYIELIYVKNGSATAFCDGKEYTLTENSFFCVFPHKIHHYKDSVNGEYYILIIKPNLLLKYNDIFLNNEPKSPLCEFQKGKDDNVIYLLETTLNEFNRDGYSGIIEAYITLIFGKLIKCYTFDKIDVPQDTVLGILKYCSENYKENITVSDIAKSQHVSRSCVSHIFSTKLSINFCNYLNSLRLTDAVKLLENKNYSISEISDMSGFPTIRTFNRAFLKRYGMSPTEYRKQIL